MDGFCIKCKAMQQIINPVVIRNNVKGVCPACHTPIRAYIHDEEIVTKDQPIKIDINNVVSVLRSDRYKGA